MVVDNQSPWLENVSNEIISAKNRLEKKEIRKYKPDMLLHCARKVDNFAPTCRTCQRYQGDIKKLTGYLKNIPRLSLDDEKDYFKKGNIIGEHLQAQHKLVIEGKYFGWGAVIGAAFGAMAGWASGLLFVVLPVALGIGCLIGWAFESKARKEGKTI